MEKTFNSFDRMMEMFPEADCVMLERTGAGDEMIAGSPMNSETGEMWMGMTMISSLEEAFECKHPLACSDTDEELGKIISEKRGEPESK